MADRHQEKLPALHTNVGDGRQKSDVEEGASAISLKDKGLQPGLSVPGSFPSLGAAF